MGFRSHRIEPLVADHLDVDLVDHIDFVADPAVHRSKSFPHLLAGEELDHKELENLVRMHHLDLVVGMVIVVLDHKIVDHMIAVLVQDRRIAGCSLAEEALQGRLIVELDLGLDNQNCIGLNLLRRKMNDLVEGKTF